MKLVVWKIGQWKHSRYDYGLNLQVQLKGIDEDNQGETYKLNLNSGQSNKEDWLRLLVEGTVLDDVGVVSGTRTIDKFHVPRLSTKTTQGKEAVDEQGQIPGQLELTI